MMRSLYSGVAGLKTHQTKMDVIGNNIANVNTVGFKASTVTFSDVLYQTTQSASGPNAATGAAGKNAKQIGLGSVVSGITTNISTAGGTQTTNNPFDVQINGDGFFIVNQGGTNYFTKAGAFQVDANGTLCTTNGATVMGWLANDTGTAITKDTVKPLTVMSAANMYADPEATTAAYVSGNIDTKDKQAANDGTPVSFTFYDNKGNEYTAKMLFKAGTAEGSYTVSLANIYDSNNKSIFATQAADGKWAAATGTSVTFAGTSYTVAVDATTGAVTLSGTGSAVNFDPSTGKFVSAGAAVGAGTAANTELTLHVTNTANSFKDVSIDFSGLTNYSAGGTSTATARKGDKDNLNAGRQVGEMSAISIDSSGVIRGTYTNGTSKMLGQLALATFSNPSGLESVGDNLFAQTKNSGDFDGIGVDPSANGSSLTTGALEMSNVDLAAQFTDMITTQRGFQANSRTITTTDSMLEELINLKR